MEKKKRVIKKSKNSSVPSLKDFQIFEKGVERLEEIGRELSNLNTKGYEEEVNSIRSKLKNVSYIPQIEIELRDLKDKINGNYRKKISQYSGIYKKIKELKESIPNEHQKIREKIKKLEEHVIDKDKFAEKINEIKKEVSLVKDMPKIQNQIRSFKKFVDARNEEEKRKKDLLKKIDPEVNFLINDKFNLSLNEIKAELSKRINNKETKIKKQLHDDLKTRKEIFKEQYNKLENSFEKKYREKVKEELDKEIKDNFDRVLNNKLNKIKGDIRKKLKEDNKVKLKKEELKVINENKNLANSAIARKKLELEKEYSNKLKVEKKKLLDHFHDNILAHQAVIDAKMHENLTSRLKVLNNNYKEKLRSLQEKIEDISKAKETLGVEKKELEESDKKYKEDLIKNIKKEKEEAIRKAIKKNYNLITKKLKEEFDDRLRLEIRAKEVEFERKKSELTLEIQKKARELFN